MQWKRIEAAHAAPVCPGMHAQRPRIKQTPLPLQRSGQPSSGEPRQRLVPARTPAWWVSDCECSQSGLSQKKASEALYTHQP